MISAIRGYWNDLLFINYSECDNIFTVIRSRVYSWHIFIDNHHVSAASWLSLTGLWPRCLSHRSQSIDLLCKSMDWFLYDRDLRHERVNWFFLLHLMFRNRPFTGVPWQSCSEYSKEFAGKNLQRKHFRPKTLLELKLY